jgi:hypothetical protein
MNSLGLCRKVQFLQQQQIQAGPWQYAEWLQSVFSRMKMHSVIFNANVL